MQHVVCSCCCADETSPIVTGHDLLHGTAGEFTLAQCNLCGLMYLNPQPTASELEAHYPEDWEAHVGTQKQRLGWLHRLDHNYGIEKRHRVIMRSSQTGRLLDVGCGAGAFLDGMRERQHSFSSVSPKMLVLFSPFLSIMPPFSTH